ncbi:CRISPR-associated protein Cmr4 [Methanophagales archaeon]|nr:CRISPR-associated protein Cmr4 [Methanophagales archaeon]
MYKLARPFFMVVETPLHAGSGADLGIVDMPIQRERHTGFPKIEASGLKGCMREAFEGYIEKGKRKEGDKQIIEHYLLDTFQKKIDKMDVDQKVKDWLLLLKGPWPEKKESEKTTIKLIKMDEAISLTFGPEQGDEHAGALGFTDARLLLFPVKSMKGVFAWITCSKVLERFRNDLELAEIKGIPEMPEENTAPKGCQLFITDKKIVLEEYTFEIKNKEDNEEGVCSKFAKWLSENVIPQGNEYHYWQQKIKKDVVVLPDDDFRDFVNLSTEVITRTKIDNVTGTVQSGALFTEEYLPTETILYSLALSTPIFKEKDNEKGIFKRIGAKSEEERVMEFFTAGLPKIIQVGGNATIGKGIVRTSVWSDKNVK